MIAREVRVDDDIGVLAARRTVRDLASDLGFDHRAAIELCIAASELASNILKYGVRGSMRFEAAHDATRGAGLRIHAFDHGPPFHDFSLALQDGYDDRGPVDPGMIMRRGGIGAGLGAVKRFTDEIGWEPSEGGKRIWATRYLVRPAAHQPR